MGGASFAPEEAVHDLTESRGGGAWRGIAGGIRIVPDQRITGHHGDEEVGRGVSVRKRKLEADAACRGAAGEMADAVKKAVPPRPVEKAARYEPAYLRKDTPEIPGIVRFSSHDGLARAVKQA